MCARKLQLDFRCDQSILRKQVDEWDNKTFNACVKPLYYLRILNETNFESTISEPLKLQKRNLTEFTVKQSLDEKKYFLTIL